jgi:hypothetical protein
MKEGSSSGRVLSIVPVGLVLLGALIPLAGSGFAVWGMALAWVAAIAVFLIARAILRPDPRTRVFIDIVGLVMTLLVFAPEGGWWFVPAVAAQLLIDKRAAAAPRSGVRRDIPAEQGR